ncbi:unnamed protein product [Porites lobata]|uniref:Uncharacterized protein n=1 Tax=Porites lobata TaxID=104759 RepID=A0ABN8PNT0_9CNID|nr:unnamed protein product [Porites lobata]
MTDVFGPSTTNSQSSRTPQNKGKAWQFQKCLELDRKKQAALEGEIEELSKLEKLRSIKASRVPAEPECGSPRVLMVAQHPFQRRVTRFFSAAEKMVAVYDWSGSLDLHPEHFSLQVHPATTISPEEGIFGYEGVVMYMKALDEPLLMGTGSPEISSHRFWYLY